MMKSKILLILLEEVDKSNNKSNKNTNQNEIDIMNFDPNDYIYL